MGDSTLLGLLLARVVFPKRVDDGVGAGQWSRGRAPPAATRVTRATLASLQQPAQRVQLPAPGRVDRSCGRAPRAATRAQRATSLQQPTQSAQLTVRVDRSRGRVPRAATRAPHAASLQLHAHRALHRYSNLRGARAVPCGARRVTRQRTRKFFCQAQSGPTHTPANALIHSSFLLKQNGKRHAGSKR